MNVRWIGIFLFFLFLPLQGYAETVYLRDGGSVEGEIMNEGSYYIVIKVGGIPRRYYNDQILRIEKDKEAYEYALGAVKIDPAQFKDISEEKVNLIVTLMEVNGTRQNMQANMDQITAQAPAEKQAELKALLDVNAIIGHLVPIYDKYYTSEELKEMIDFYRTPTGKKLIEATPHIMQEAVQSSVQYFKEHTSSP